MRLHIFYTTTAVSSNTEICLQNCHNDPTKGYNMSPSPPGTNHRNRIIAPPVAGQSWVYSQIHLPGERHPAPALGVPVVLLKYAVAAAAVVVAAAAVQGTVDVVALVAVVAVEAVVVVAAVVVEAAAPAPAAVPADTPDG